MRDGALTRGAASLAAAWFAFGSWPALGGIAPALRGGASVASAQVPLAEWVKSGEVQRPELPVYSTPDEHGSHRGTVLRGVRLPIVTRVDGAGCGDGRFAQVGDHAYVCERELRPSGEPPGAPAPPPGALAADADLPYEYLQVAHDSTRAYASLDDYATDDFEKALGKGFAVAVVARMKAHGVAFVRTLSGFYIRESDLRPLHGSDFAGVELGDEGLSHVGWVVQDGAHLLEQPTNGTLPAPLSAVARLSRVQIASEAGGVLQLSDGGAIDARAVVRPSQRQPPPDLAPGERWIDIDLTRQLLVAYEGDRPVFATVISSGRERPNTRTPTGTFHIWVKLRGSDMHDSEHYIFEQSYAIEQVPWVQYFKDGYALHAAFWHDRFGEPHSRGCINLSPHDARWLFDFTQPALPQDWFAVRPVEPDTGTRIIVRASGRGQPEVAHNAAR